MKCQMFINAKGKKVIIEICVFHKGPHYTLLHLSMGELRFRCPSVILVVLCSSLQSNNIPFFI